MANVVTAMLSLCDEHGNYFLEVTAEDGSVFEVLIPPKMSYTVRTTIQENEARQLASRAAHLGVIILDVTKVQTGVRKQTNETTLIIETEQMGWWGFRFDAPTARQLLMSLGKILKPHRGTQE